MDLLCWNHEGTCRHRIPLKCCLHCFLVFQGWGDSPRSCHFIDSSLQSRSRDNPKFPIKSGVCALLPCLLMSNLVPPPPSATLGYLRPSQSELNLKQINLQKQKKRLPKNQYPTAQCSKHKNEMIYLLSLPLPSPRSCTNLTHSH